MLPHRLFGSPFVRRQCQLLRLFHKSIPQRQLPPAILRRAQSLSDEHRTLASEMAAKYDTKLARRVGELAPISSALSDYQSALLELSELEEMLSDHTIDDQLRALASEDLPVTAARLEAIEKQLQHALVPKHPFAHHRALVEIRPGAGGGEAALFANDLFKMYTTYIGIRGWPVSVVSLSMTDDRNGLTEGIFEVPVEGAYDVFRTEAGVHRVQRVPATETKGRVHTSTATVIVLPSFAEEVAEGEEDPDAVIDMKDVKIDIMRARGAGGQHVNTTDSAVRMTHIPTGTVAAIQDSRSQHKNREKCLSVLRSRIAEKRRAEREQKELEIRRGVGGAKIGAGRSDKMRTYNYNQNRVTDHRCGMSLHNLPGCMRGEEQELGKLMEGCRRWMTEAEVEALAAEDGKS